MRLLRLLTVLAAVATFSALATPQADAQRLVQIVQTDCDTLSLDPPLVRVEFGVINRFSTVPVCSIHLIPIQSGPTPADSCRILECSSAPGWTCSLDGNGGANWRADPSGDPGCIELNEKHEFFDIILDPLYCCYRVEYDDGAGNVFYVDEVCFECQKPVPTLGGTWGSLKATYR